MEVPVYNLAREVVKHIEISDDVFGVPFNQAVVHQAMVRQRANARQGTASTKTRSEVSGTSRKLYRRRALVMLGLVAAGRRYAGGEVSPLVLNLGATGKLCLKNAPAGHKVCPIG